MNAHKRPQYGSVIQPDSSDDELPSSSHYRSRVRLILSRAALVYLVLFLGLGVVMSALGVSPLAKNGLMPKALLVFVGVSILLAIANTLSDLVSEQGQGFLSWMHNFVRTAIRRK